MSDILRRASGFYTVYNRYYETVGTRGLKIPGDASTKVLLLIDGHRLNDNVYSQAMIGTDFPLDIDLIDRVEITRGSGSCLYGNNAFFGVINVITKKASAIDGTEISADIGSSDTYKGRISYGGKFSDSGDILLSVSGYDSNGDKNLYYKEFDDAATHNGIAENLDRDRFEKLFLKMTYNDFTLTGVHGSRDKDIPTAAYGTWFNYPYSANDRRSYAELKYDHSIDKDTGISARIYADRYTYYGNYPYQGFSEDETSYLYYQREKDPSEWIGGELRLNKTISEQDRLTFGAEYQYNILQNILNYDEEPYYLFVDDRHTSSTWAVYLENEFKMTDTLILGAGVRYDHYDSFGGTTNPRLSVIYTPFESTTLKLVYGTAFRAPNINEIASEDFAYGTFTINPEKIRSYEAIIEQNYGRHFQGFVSGFMYKIEGLIAQVPWGDEWVIYTNADDADAKGIEAEIRTKWDNGFQASLNYTFQDVRNSETDETLPVSPKHLIKANLVVPLIQDKLFISSEGQYMSSRKTISGNNTDGYFVVNTTLLSLNWFRRLELSASIYNMFDKIYSDPGAAEHVQEAIEQSGRSFRIKLTYLF
ncbi:MAG: TonB-dependent receptor [Desulfobacteraceae bacterium]|nr:TonB-dependent receptor [Desulfobacteraceae bacterium]